MNKKSDLTILVLFSVIFFSGLYAFSFDKKTELADLMTLTAPTEISLGKSISQPTSPFLLDSIWIPIAIPESMPDRLTHAAVYNPVNDRIYMVGGCPAGIAGTNLALCQEYNPNTDTWTDKASMSTPRGWIQGAVITRLGAQGRIYVMCGYSNSSTALTVNECYDIAANTWTTVAPSPRATCAYQIGVWRDSLIYLIGGTTPWLGAPEVRVSLYDPFTNTWTSATDLPEHCDMGSSVIISDTIYIVGGYNRTSGTLWTNMLKGAINPINPTQITWITGLTLPPNSFTVATAALGNKVYWIAGTATWYYIPGSDTIYPFVPYPIVVARTQMVARTAEAIQELYVVAGDSGGNWEPPNRTYMKFTFDVGVNETKPTQTFSLLYPKPNPAKREVRIAYSLPNQCKAELVICDASGRIITKTTEEKESGQYEYLWQGKDQRGKAVPNGIYFVRLKTGNNLHTQKITITR